MNHDTAHIDDTTAQALGWYVYRLIDPRTGQTFYVGKGRGDRVLQHAKGAVDYDEDSDPKLQTIKEIGAAGLSVIHLIHRHGLRDEETAFEVEAALIDAFPGLVNKATGHRSGDFGCRHLDEIIAEYKREPFEVAHEALLISIGTSFEEESRSIYDAVRFAWRIDVDRARKHPLVIAHRRGIVHGVFRVDEWLPATRKNFPMLPDDMPDRYGFCGHEAPNEITELYLRKRVPERFRQRGAANPIRYLSPDQ